uniref:AAA+ ATPase domain-containing protein n=1 Tax=Fagus sylvatica TaxID=28930 RepID=A0A2N9GA68_FAGSY
MAENVVEFLLDKLARFLENEIEGLSGGREEVLYLRGELERLRAFLKVADAFEESDEELKVWVKQVREIAYDTEDSLDEFRLLQAHDHGDGFYGSLSRFSCCIKNRKARGRIVSELQGINSRITIICKGHERLLYKMNKAEQGSGSTSARNKSLRSRGDALLIDKIDLVGIDEPKQKLVWELMKGGCGRKVVPVAAMGGTGKTTLAKQIEELLKDMIRQIFSVVSRPFPEGLDSMNNDRLRRIIKDLLQKRRYLMVLDDVWHLEEWDDVKYALPNNNYGSRVMLTTRNADVASTSVMESVGEVFNLKPLPPNLSWDLFCRKTFQGNACPNYLEEICKNILKKCEGLPLAIVAISGVLATKDQRRIDEWDMVGRSFGAEIDGNDKLKDLKKVLSLSFNDLPYYLKSCFLYLSIFPEDYPLERMRLIRLWIAEGFIEAKVGKTPEEVADDYLNELLNRGLLQVAATTSDGRVKLYHVHDLLREIIVSKSRDQKFTAIAKDQNTVCLRGTKVKDIPSFVGKLQNLETLDLKHSRVTELPVEILKLQKLRHLLVYHFKLESYEYFHSRYGFQIQGKIGALRSLQKLLGFIEANQDGDEEIIDLQHLSSPPLLIQRLYLRGRLETLPHWIPSLHGLVYEGDSLCFRTGGFKKLKVLGLDKFSELRSMQVEAGAMPCVEKLIIQRCTLLKKVPIGIEYLTKLKVLEFFDMPEELIKTLRPDEQGSDYWKVAHIPEVYSTYWREGGWEVNSLESLNDGENSPRPNTIILTSHELQTRWK